MQQLLNKCLNVNNSENVIDEEESLFQTCKLIVGLSDNIGEVNCLNNDSMDNDFLCGFDDYAKKNCREEIKMSVMNGMKERKLEQVNLNAYCENDFNRIFNIEYVDLPVKFYETIFLNFFSSFIQLEKMEKIFWEDYIYVMKKIYDTMKNQKYVLLHKFNSVPHQQKKNNVNYKNGDALICSDNIIAVADGVSSIKNSGINVSNFSNELLKKCLNLYLYRCVNNELFEEQNQVIFKHYNLKYKMDEVLKPIICRGACSSNFLGASTLLFSSIEKEKLHICTIGDCQMLIVRLKENYLRDKIFEKVKIKIQASDEASNFTKRESNITTIVDCDTGYDLVKDEVKGEGGKIAQSSAKLNGHLNDDLSVKLDDNISVKLDDNISVKLDDNLSVKLNDNLSVKLDDNLSVKLNDNLSVKLNDNLNVKLDDNLNVKLDDNLNVSFNKWEDEFSSNMSKCQGVYKNGENDNRLLNNKFALKDLYLKRKELYRDDINSSINNIDDVGKKNANIVLYVEEVLGEEICDDFEKYVSSQNYKIGNLSFTIKDGDLYQYPNIRSDTIISRNISCATENDFYENEKNNLYLKSTIDETGFRKLLNFFNIERKDILVDSKNYVRMENTNEILSREWTGGGSSVGVHKKEGDVKKGSEIESRINREKEKNRKSQNYMNVNNYRFRCYKEELSHFYIIYKSKIQQHYFNCPYQITFMPTNLSTNIGKDKSNITLKNNIKMNKYNDIISKCLRYCEYSSIDIRTNDIIVSGSDGLFDNIYDDDIMEILYNNFYIIKDNDFINLKHFVNFVDEYKRILKYIEHMIWNSSLKGKRTKYICSGSLRNSSDGTEKRSEREELNTKGGSNKKNGISVMSYISSDDISGNLNNRNKNRSGVRNDNKNDHISDHRKNHRNDHRNDHRNNHRSDHRNSSNSNKNSRLGNYQDKKRKSEKCTTKAANDTTDEEGENLKSFTLKGNSISYLGKKIKDKKFGTNNNCDVKKNSDVIKNSDVVKNKGKDQNNSLDKKYKNGLSFAMNKLHFPSKIKGMFSIKSKNKNTYIAKKKERVMDKERTENILSKDKKNGKVKENDKIVSNENSYRSNNNSYNSFMKNKTFDYDDDDDNRKYSANSEHIKSGKQENVQENLENDGSSASYMVSDAFTEGSNFDKFNKSNNDYDGVWVKNMHPNQLQKGGKQNTEIIVDDYVKYLRRKETNYTEKWMTEQKTLTEFSNVCDMKYNIMGNSERNNYDIKDMRNIRRKKKVIIEKKIDCSIFLYEPSDFILFDKNNNIYLNAKKACDEIIELATILASQPVNNTLLKKRRKEYNEEQKNMNGNKNKKSIKKTKTHELVKKNIQINNKCISGNLVSNINEKETYLFDQVNYDDIQSNKSNDKIILTPISEFIFDKYEKYFNMGKPDDTTVILSVVKENKYNS
ncbi:conserved Plasmodium protein, unknown function [Plasmodium malariae]|uniref:Uncharacterized protein n=1 Tax=Plasmodium malariae TaxID=5858 RepID=A0A1A8VR69_PLAMA|nr:conserved Plasmodium protein, unknown function [Plasmodium malariae]SBS81301.1 conserved Plasmodium protein, unknown function [Plasmodium malariae]SBT86874.1 conserved Plasmodium protein, unknown function [Plasmodium malariae]